MRATILRLTALTLAVSTLAPPTRAQHPRVDLPAGSPLLGVPLVTQWVTLDLVSPACPLFRIEMSNALQVTIEARR